MWVSNSCCRRSSIWTTACIMGAFSRVSSVARSLQGVEVRMVWPGQGSRFCGSDPWILLPEAVQVPSSLSVRGRPMIGLTGRKRCMP